MPVSWIIFAALTGPCSPPEAGNQGPLSSSRSLGTGGGWGSDSCVSSPLCPAVTGPGCDIPTQRLSLSVLNRHNLIERWGCSLGTLPHPPPRPSPGILGFSWAMPMSQQPTRPVKGASWGERGLRGRLGHWTQLWLSLGSCL